MPSPRLAIPLIVLAQLFGTSLWFSANSAAADLIRVWQLAPADLGSLTNAVQAGFIAGTLGFALTGLADRFPASRIFALCALLGAPAMPPSPCSPRASRAPSRCAFASAFAWPGSIPWG